MDFRFSLFHGFSIFYFHFHGWLKIVFPFPPETLVSDIFISFTNKENSIIHFLFLSLIGFGILVPCFSMWCLNVKLCVLLQKLQEMFSAFDSLVFCLYPCFVSLVQIFPHRSQRECLSVHVNFCVGSLLYSRFIITIVTFYCRIGKLLCQLISVLSPICPIKHIITYLAPSCLVGSVAGHTQNL